MIVLLAWVLAVLLAGALLGVLGLELWGHVRRLLDALAETRRDLGPGVRQVATAWPGVTGLVRDHPGRHRAESPAPPIRSTALD
ncbi:MAG TPA: hypothetical protein VLJ59_15690 [Mycobacteriales bacterium]|nr:hypothetical protein [Mycobacteriales bacterium]